MPLERGAVVARYVVLDRVGEGAMGVVYAAYDPDLDRKLALKVIRPEPRFGPITVGGERQRLLREAQAMARVSHPAVVAVYDVGAVGDEVFLAMELVDGLPMDRWLAARPRGVGEILDAFLAAGAGLQAAHEAGLVHRDFKPANVLIRPDGRVQVTDFGLAREPLERAVSAPALEASATAPAPAPAPAPAGEPSRPSPASVVTMAGVVLGTPRYMAPEQRRREAVDARADQYAFCVALREALTGELPAGLAPETVPLDPSAIPVRPLAPGRLPRLLRAALDRGLSVDPAGRFPSMDALLAALRRARRRDRRALAAGALLAAALASTSAFVFTRAPPCDEGRRLAGIWDAARRAELSTAFEKARGPAGASTFTLTSRALDEMAAAWTSGAQDACQAARASRQSREVAALRAGCLEQSLAGLAAVTSVLARADAQTVDRAQDALGTWGGAGRCSDVPSLLGSEPALPPAAASAAVQLRARLAESDALSGVGKNAEAVELARAQAEAARALDAPALEAEALHRLAQNQDRAGQTEAALATAREAFPLALRSGHRRISVLLTAAVVYYLGTRQTKFDEAHFWGKVGHALVGPNTSADEAFTLDANIAGIHASQGRHEEAEAIYRRIAEHRVRTLGERNTSTLNALGNLGLTLQALGRHEEALEVNQRVLALRTELFGPTHRRVATTVGNLADSQRELGMTAEALANFRRALELRRDALGPEHRDTAVSELMLASALTGAGQATEALPLIAHAAESLKKAKGGTSGYSAVAECVQANALGALGRWAEALPHHRACLAEYRALWGDAHPSTTLAVRDTCESLLRTGRRDEMLAMIDPMLAAEKKASGETSAAYRLALAKTAELLLAAGDLDRAEKALAAAEPEITARERPDSRARALALVVRAELELARGRTSPAADAARVALAMPHLARRAPELAARAQAALGRALLHGPDASLATALLGQARAFFEADPTRYDRELAGISAASAAR